MERHVRPEVAAGAIIADEYGRIVVVDPKDKPFWSLPGGRVHENETPRQGRAWEVTEELGLQLKIGPLLAHAFFTALGDDLGRGQPARSYYLFDAGQLSARQRKSIRLAGAELASYRFSAPWEIASESIPPALHPLWTAALNARASGAIAYLEL